MKNRQGAHVGQEAGKSVSKPRSERSPVDACSCAHDRKVPPRCSRIGSPTGRCASSEAARCWRLERGGWRWRHPHLGVTAGQHLPARASCVP
jgi:hypothetical protein